MLLNVDYPATKECHFEVFVNVDLFGAEIDDFFRLPQGTLHLIGRHPHLNRLGLALLLLAASTLGLLAALLLSTLLLLLLITALRVLRIVTD